MAKNDRQRHEGIEPYTPTRLEWLALELGSDGGAQPSTSSDFSLDFIPDHVQDSILIVAQYMPTVDHDVMRISIDSARRIIAIKAKSYNWDSWLGVNERIIPLTPFSDS